MRVVDGKEGDSIDFTFNKATGGYMTPRPVEKRQKTGSSPFKRRNLFPWSSNQSSDQSVEP